MKKGTGWICLLMAVFAAAGLLGGCAAGGQKEAATTAALSTTTVSPAYDTAGAMETWAATSRGSGFSVPGQKIGEDSRRSVHNTEEYRYYPENLFISVADVSLSTSEAGMDTTSYVSIRRMVLDGNRVPEDAVRIEKMLNYFCYDYPKPKEGEPFLVTTRLVQCPWSDKHDLLQIGLQAEKLDESTMPRPNLVFLLSVSGSTKMPDKLDLVKRTFLMMAEYLKSDDTVSIVTYTSDDRIVLNGAAGEDRLSVTTATESLSAGGSTHGSRGIRTAYQLVEEHYTKGGNNQVVLAISRDLNVGITGRGGLTQLIKDQKDRSVLLSVLGFGTGNLKDNGVEAMANNGSGQYLYVGSIAEAREVLVEEASGTFFTIAKDMKFQVEFNPAGIKGYRLIGYEDRVMADQSFEGGTKGGGEIGAGHRVAVLYGLIPTDSKGLIPETSLKYQTQPKETSQVPDADTPPIYNSEWFTMKIRYKQPDQDGGGLLEYPVKDDNFHIQIPGDMVFASCMTETGLLLRSSEYASSASYTSVISRLQDLEHIKENDYNNESLYLVKRVATAADQSRQGVTS